MKENIVVKVFWPYQLLQNPFFWLFMIPNRRIRTVNFS